MIKTHYTLIICDVDGTLRQTKSGRDFPLDAQDWQWIPGRLERLQAFHEQGIALATASNQANVCYAAFQDEIIRLNPNWQRKNYATEDEVTRSFGALFLPLQEQGTPVRLFLSIWDERLRRLLTPSSREVWGQVSNPMQGTMNLPVYLVEAGRIAVRMTREFTDFYGIMAEVSAHPTWRKPESGMIDTARQNETWGRAETLMVGDRPEDEQAARNAGVDFLWADDFFAAHE